MFKRKHYKFTNKKTSKRGVASTLLFLAAAAMIVYGIYLSYKAHGNGTMLVGVMGIGGLVSATAGLVFGMNSLKDEDVFHTFSWIGAVGNAVIWFCILFMIMVGI